METTSTAYVHVMKDGLALLATSAVILTVNIVHKMMRISVYPVMETGSATSVSFVCHSGTVLDVA